MKAFMDEDFLLQNEVAQTLFHEYAKKMPIIDYHCHLSPQEIYENRAFKNLTEAWLYGDHYKWRVMRANGVDEELITGNASDYDKFLAWARTVPKLIGNPLYNWTHLELQRYFQIQELLNEETAPAIWEKVNAQLASGAWNVRDFITNSNVKVVCTTDDPADDLRYHIALQQEQDFDVQVLPSYRPDKFLEINRATFLPWLEKLEAAVKKSITTYEQLQQALVERIEFFDEIGSCVSDHALDIVRFEEAGSEQVAAIFEKALKGEDISDVEEFQYKSHLLVFLGKEYSKRDWTMQFHMNALRNTNTRMFAKLGPDTGYDSMNDDSLVKPLVRILDALALDDLLPKTILYSLNPKDNYALATIMNSFQDGKTAGKIQFGTAWWFNDQKDGMLDQMRTLANVGVFSQFIGMLTDSRSFLSYTRHEYFRRLVCQLIGEWVANGEVPNDMHLLGPIVENISYKNAEHYFGFSITSVKA